MKTAAVASMLAVAFFTAACAEDPSTPTDHLKIYETCLQTQCDVYQQEGSSACSACESACFGASYDCDPDSACSESCSPRDCSDEDRNTCVDQGYQVVFANNPDPSIVDACNAALDHIASCGYESQATASDCSRYASTESADVAVAAYQCMAQVDCSAIGDGTSLVSCDPPAGTFGDELCANLANACPSEACSSDFQAELDADGAWLRPDALDAARSCLSQPSCDETSQCLSAWVKAVE